jgi:thymidylate synthase
MTYPIQGETLQQIWPKMIKYIMEEGRTFTDQRNTEIKEVLNMMWTVENPMESDIPEGYPLGPNALDEYRSQLLDPSMEGFVYTYGNRLNQYVIFKPIEEPRSNIVGLEDVKDIKLEGAFNIVNQVKKIIMDLKENPETRRATMVTWRLPEDLINEEVPCMIMVDYKIRDNKLFTTAVWRSHDMFSASVANFFALLELSKYVGKKLGIELGSITIQSVSAHIYFYDWKEAKKTFEQKYWNGVEMVRK